MGSKKNLEKIPKNLVILSVHLLKKEVRGLKFPLNLPSWWFLCLVDHYLYYVCKEKVEERGLFVLKRVVLVFST